MTMTSLMFTPMGSVAISGRPVFDTMVSISSGKRLPEPLLDQRRLLDRLLQRDAGQAQDLDRDGPLVESRNELGAEERRRPAPPTTTASARHDQDGQPAPQAPVEGRRVALA